MDLFDVTNETGEKKKLNLPLYTRVRPSLLEDFVGQKKILPFIELIRKDRFPSFIFWGPPGSGKTTLAHIIRNITEKDCVFISAVLSGVKELRETVEKAKRNLKLRNQQTILFIDEIHRFNKAQQDALLPHIENGTFILIGATTENPGFEVIPALLSRCKVISFSALEEPEIKDILNRVVKKEKISDRISEDGIKKITELCDGDARSAINLLETCLNNISEKQISEKEILKLYGNRQLKYDKKGDYHYDNISAFIKSLRGSDADAAIYYLARMLESSEDPKFIARRLMILASEDIGNADPRALQLACNAMEAVHAIGMPEARIILAQVTTYLATAPKSNASYLAIEKALRDVRNGRVYPPPLHLRNPVNRVMKEQGYGTGYKYAHDHPGNVVKQCHLPEKLHGTTYYHPTENGYEKTITQRLKYWQTLFSAGQDRENS